MKIWTPAEEAKRLEQRFADVSQAAFAREHKIPGGASMLSQHIKGRRPMNLEAATAYARGFAVPLEEISPRLAEEVRRAEGLALGPDQRNPATVEDHPVATAMGLIQALGALLLPLDQTDREQAEVLLKKLAMTPEDSDRLAAKLGRLLGESPTPQGSPKQPKVARS